MVSPVTLRSVTPADKDWITEDSQSIGGQVIAVSERLIDLTTCPGLVAEASGLPMGCVLWSDKDTMRQILAIWTSPTGRGTGQALIDAVVDDARHAGLNRLEVETTNDNLTALKFYQRHDFCLTSLEIGGYAKVLTLKNLDNAAAPTGQEGIPIRDILRLERAI